MTTTSSPERIWTIPNILSIIRLVGIPVFIWVILVVEHDGWAFALLFVSGVTDWLDGKLARLLDQMSKLGALLDPLVDRLYLVTTLATFVLRDFIPWWLAVALVVRDVALFAVLPLYKRRGLPPPEVIYLGKAATFALMFAFPGLLAGHTDWAVGPVLGALGAAFLVWGFALYMWTGVLYLWKAWLIATRVPVGLGYPQQDSPTADSTEVDNR